MQDVVDTIPGTRQPVRVWEWPARAWDFVRRWPVIPAAILVVLVLAAIFAPLISTHDPVAQDLTESLAPPTWIGQWYEEHPNVERHLLGTDNFGRDVFSRVVYGSRVSLMVAFVAMVSGVILGAWAGLASGYYGGIIDEILTRFVDVWNALPFLLLALVVSVTIGQGIIIMMVLLISLTWVGLVRNVRAEVLSVKTRDYVALARVAGASDFRIMLRHIFPGTLNLLLVMASLRVGGLILTEASLSFLGVGVPSHIPTWGIMISDGRAFLAVAWWISVFPGVGIFLTVMSMNFLGDWIRDRTDPRLRQVR